MKKTVCIAAVAMFAIGVMLLLRAADTANKVAPIPKNQLGRLVKCMIDDTCRVPRTETIINGHVAFAMYVFTPNAAIEYAFLDGSTLRVMVLPTATRQPIMIEDAGYTGFVSGILESSPDKELSITTTRSRDFDEKMLRAQKIYMFVMKIAEESILPPPKTAGALKTFL